MRPAAPVPHVLQHGLAPKGRFGRFLERLAEGLHDTFGPLLLPLYIAGALVSYLATRTQMPGVTVETFPNPGPTEVLNAPGATLFLAGLCDRGRTDQVITVRSYPEFVTACGPYVTYGALHDQVKLYFALGGTRVNIARVVGGSATKGTLTLNDRDGTPDPTLKIDAVSAGAWSANVQIQVADGAISNTFTISVWVDQQLAETYPNLASPAAAVTALSASNYVVATDLASASSAPSNNPAVLTKTPLSAGSDDRGSVNGAALVAALARFGLEYGDGVVAIPGYDSSVVGAGLIAHAKAFQRVTFLATTRTASTSTAKSAAATFNQTSGNEHAALLFPWIQVDDGAGGRRSISPEGYAAGARARAHVTEGPWRAPAGVIAAAPQVLGVETELTSDEGNDLNDSHVAAIRKVGGRPQLYGYVSLSLDNVHYRLLTVRDVLNAVAHQGRRALQPLVFGTIDSSGHFQKSAETAIIGVLEPMKNAGGLFELTDPDTGEKVDSAYDVDAGPGVNPPDQIANGQFTVNAALRVSPTAEKILLRITAAAVEETL